MDENNVSVADIAADDVVLSSPSKGTRSNMVLSTSVFVEDDILVWRPAKLHYKSNDGKKASVTLCHWPIMDYSIKNHDKIITKRPKLFLSNKSVAMPQCSDERAAQDTDLNEVWIDLKSYENGAPPLQDVDEGSNIVVRDDMIDLSYLHEASILYNLATRHQNGMPYTRAGAVIVALNPQKWIDGLYSEEKGKLYADQFLYSSRKKVHSLPPHIYEVSSLAYRSLIIDGQDQAILVSGATGAGKTETVKILMTHLTTFESRKKVIELKSNEEEKEQRGKIKKYSIKRKRKPRASMLKSRWKHYIMRHWKDKSVKIEIPKDSLQESVDKENSVNNSLLLEKHTITLDKCEDSTVENIIIQRVLDSNPLLEAFGNAKTAWNNNSSRFSRYTRMQFHVEYLDYIPRCVLAGSICNTFLLQKSRVVTHEKKHGERSFHIFYQLLAGAEIHKRHIWDGLEGKGVENFKYLGVSSPYKLDGLTDAERWEKTLDAFKIFGINGEDYRNLMRALCVVLELGNLAFQADPHNDEGSIIRVDEELESLSEILGVNKETISSGLLKRTIITPTETLHVPLTPKAAKDGCDALGKEIYSRVFDWLVKTINGKTCAEKNYGKGDADFGTIGLLDIFGFEIFQTNLFEQLCVNHANEKIQHKFTEDLFQAVKVEYKSEGINMDTVDFVDNIEVLKLIEGKLGLINLLNEECLLPRGTDAGFVNKIYSNNSTLLTPLFKENRFGKHKFGIDHYAGAVVYDATNFVTKNLDAFPQDLFDCVLQSNNKIIQSEFQAVHDKKKDSKRKTFVSEMMWTKFRLQLNDLMSQMSNSNARYIRCIVPNQESKPFLTDFKHTLTQLRYAGIMSAITFSRSSFPNQMPHELALKRFSILNKSNDKNPDVQESVQDLMTKLLVNVKSQSDSGSGDTKLKEAFVCGRTRIYFSAGTLEYLEGERALFFQKMATIIQRQVRRKDAVAKYEVLKKQSLVEKPRVKKSTSSMIKRMLKISTRSSSKGKHSKAQF